jgi:hypothetical protein
MATKSLHQFVAAAASFAASTGGSAIHVVEAFHASAPLLARPSAVA